MLSYNHAPGKPATSQAEPPDIRPELGQSHHRETRKHEKDDVVTTLRTAVRELVKNAEAHIQDHPCDVRFGRDVVRVLEEAERQITANPRIG
jgi:hypothetical protein